MQCAKGKAYCAAKPEVFISYDIFNSLHIIHLPSSCKNADFVKTANFTKLMVSVPFRIATNGIKLPVKIITGALRCHQVTMTHHNTVTGD